MVPQPVPPCGLPAVSGRRAPPTGPLAADPRGPRTASAPSEVPLPLALALEVRHMATQANASETGAIDSMESQGNDSTCSVCGVPLPDDDAALAHLNEALAAETAVVWQKRAAAFAEQSR